MNLEKNGKNRFYALGISWTILMGTSFGMSFLSWGFECSKSLSTTCAITAAT